MYTPIEIKEDWRGRRCAGCDQPLGDKQQHTVLDCLKALQQRVEDVEKTLERHNF